MAFSASALGAKEPLNPQLPQIENIVTPFLLDGFKYVEALEVSRAVVAGVKYEIIFKMLDLEGMEHICDLNVLEKPWLMKNSQKFRTLLSSNCSMVEQKEEDQSQYVINPVFKPQASDNEEMSEESLKYLEEQIVPYATTEITRQRKTTTEQPETSSYESSESTFKPDSKNMLDDFFKINNFFQPETTVADVGASEIGQIDETTTLKSLDQSSKDALDEMFGFKPAEKKTENTNNFANPQSSDVNEDIVQVKRIEPVQTGVKPSRGNVALNQLELEIKKSFSDLFQNNAEFQQAIAKLIENKNSQQISQDNYNHVFNILVNNLKLKIESYTNIEASTTESSTNDPSVISSASQINHYHNKRSVANVTVENKKVLNLVRNALMRLDNLDEDDMKRVVIEIITTKVYKVQGVKHHLVNLKYANSNCYEHAKEITCAQNFNKETVKMCVFEVNFFEMRHCFIISS